MTVKGTHIDQPAAEAIARFRADAARLAGAEPAGLGVAVSGGPDSLALLLLAAAAFPGRIAAATVDHGLRPAAAGEAAFVARICAALGVPHAILDVSVAAGGEGIQGEARRARYRALAAWAKERGLPALATAHHADDQAETVLMRLKRGAGVSGLSGIRAARPLTPDLRLIRPLLGWRRTELGEIIEGAGLEAVDDPANRDPRFDRTRMRRFLAEQPDFDPVRIARCATAIGETDAALDWAADALAGDRLTQDDEGWTIDPAGLPREIRRRLLRRAMAAIAPRWTGSEDVDGLLMALESGGSATLAGVMAQGGETWRLRPAPPRRPTRTPDQAASSTTS